MTSLLSDPCCLGAIAVLVIYGIVKFVALVVAEYRRNVNGSPLEEDR